MNFANEVHLDDVAISLIQTREIAPHQNADTSLAMTLLFSAKTYFIEP